MMLLIEHRWQDVRLTNSGILTPSNRARGIPFSVALAGSLRLHLRGFAQGDIADGSVSGSVLGSTDIVALETIADP